MLRHPHSMAVSALALLLALAPALSAQTPVSYQISFENRDHREAEVEIHYRDLDPGPLELRMSRTSPGRYALHEFAKNVYDVRIAGAEGAEAVVTRPDPHQWTVTGHGGEVTVRYTLYADRADGTYSQVDRTHAHLNVPATFMFARQTFALPVELEIDIPAGSNWDVATQLFPTDSPTRFTAPDHDYFLDSPLEIAELSWHEWQVPGPDGPQTIRIAMHHLGSDADFGLYATATENITAELKAVFGEWPEFDGGTYTFLACYTPWTSGDGMEHRNSTVLTSSGSLATAMTGLLGTVAHEFVHTWNIERIRPATLEPFDFEAANMSMELWFGEGFTSYLDDLALVRAGAIDEGEFLDRMAGLANSAIEARGRRYFSPMEMSMQAPFVDAATSVDPQNRTNTFLSYYTWGAAVGLGLDLTLRTEHGVSLEALMQEMWRRHGDPERPYTVNDIQAALTAVTGDAAFAADFFERFVRGTQVPEYRALMDAMGVELTAANPERGWLGGGRLTPAEAGLEVADNTLAGDPLYLAGVDRGDIVTTINGAPATREALTALLERGPGATAALEIESRGETRGVQVTLQAAPGLTATVDPGTSAERDARRADWVAPRR